jgi:hypothetical protein
MLSSYEIQRCVLRMWTDVSENCITFVFKVETQPSQKPANSRWLDLTRHPEDGGDTFLRNVGSHTDYTALYHGNIRIVGWVVNWFGKALEGSGHRVVWRIVVPSCGSLRKLRRCDTRFYPGISGSLTAHWVRCTGISAWSYGKIVVASVWTEMQENLGKPL